MTNRDQIETPVVVIDIEGAERRIDRTRLATDAIDVVPPRTEIHPLVRLVGRRVAHGAIAIAIAFRKLGEPDGRRRGTAIDARGAAT